jgi:endoglucanase
MIALSFASGSEKPVLKAALALAFTLLLGICSRAESAARSADPAAPSFRRGLNVLGYDPYWEDPGKARFRWRHFRAIRAAGFDFVRVNLFAFPHLDQGLKLDPAWLTRLDAVVRQARAARLGVILDEHDFNSCSENVAECAQQLSAVWSQLAPRYRHQPEAVAFELLNEPHGKLDADQWNRLFASLLELVRESNPGRWVVVGPTHWNSLADLPLLRLPEDDRHLLTTIHYYEPFRFTHQGASWTDNKDLHGISWGSPSDQDRLTLDFDQAARWATLNHRPVVLGEFGAFDGGGTPMALRAAYTHAVAREAERDHFAWAYWQFDADFIVWDMPHDRWVTPIRDALIPPNRQNLSGRRRGPG